MSLLKKAAGAVLRLMPERTDDLIEFKTDCRPAAVAR